MPRLLCAEEHPELLMALYLLSIRPYLHICPVLFCRFSSCEQSTPTREHCHNSLPPVLSKTRSIDIVSLLIEQTFDCKNELLSYRMLSNIRPLQHRRFHVQTHQFMASTSLLSDACARSISFVVDCCFCSCHYSSLLVLMTLTDLGSTLMSLQLGHST